MRQSTRVTQRPLLGDDASARALAVAAGAHGAYVHNALVVGEGQGSVFEHGGVDRGLVWFGPRGNLVVIADEPDVPAIEVAMTDAVERARPAWRIAMGPSAIVNALRDRSVRTPLLLRDQVYYAGSAAAADAALVSADVRRAERADRDRLVQATLALNESDLRIEPARVDRRWLRESIEQRIAEGATWVIGPIGSPQCKLDHGSDGPAGLVLEGVFTFPEARGRGLAAALVATSLRRAPGQVCLHVGMHNAPARAAYERAGMAVAGRCRLLLFG
ncbi:MAG TPA: GNAT family N-acetyltransferase [Planctomycetota bacterium]|nr:GNAT family N-acetyltransferase [Planctomycetota bacterium]